MQIVQGSSGLHQDCGAAKPEPSWGREHSFVLDMSLATGTLVGVPLAISVLGMKGTCCS